MTWTASGNDDQDAAVCSIGGMNERAISQAFWLELARTVARVRGEDDGL